jgi:hypothetical protein
VGHYDVGNASLSLKKSSPKAVIGYQRRFYDPKSGIQDLSSVPVGYISEN